MLRKATIGLRRQLENGVTVDTVLAHPSRSGRRGSFLILSATWIPSRFRLSRPRRVPGSARCRQVCWSPRDLV